MSLTKIRNRGMTLVETILALAVASAMILMLVQWQRSATDDLKAKRSADSLQQFAQIASTYLDANRSTLQSIMSADSKTGQTLTDAQRLCVVGGDTVHPAFDPYLPSSGTHGQATCAVDAQWLINQRLLPSGAPVTNPYGQTWVAIFKLVYADYDNNAGTADTTNGDIEMLIVGTGGTAAPDDDLGLATQLLGGIGGSVPVADKTGCTASPQQACGAGGAWRTNVSRFTFSY